MKAISIEQPFALFIADGDKTLHISDQPTDYRGKVLICSSDNIHKGNYLLPINKQRFQVMNCKSLYEALTQFYTVPHHQKGVAIAIAELMDCRPMKNTYENQKEARYKFLPNKYVWVLDDVFIINPFLVKEKKGLFEVEVTDRMLANI